MIEISIETYRKWVVLPADESSFCFCKRCNERVRMLSSDTAAIICGISPRAIYRWIEAGEIHFAETADGLILICLNSLDRKMRPE